MNAPQDGEPVGAEQVGAALTAGEFVYTDGATQTFNPDGTTTYVEGGRPTHGEWYLDDGHFCSFWPPAYRACYDLTWLVEDGHPAGLTFTSVVDRSTFTGRYRAPRV
ncbi:hypothetical protein [Actinoplanes solisilvae]|uniref:hypothetical protein n=1 Tax=Actinoplanes solisilvae TaxID=2486853 RepID=UPI000FD711CC|nr:hypothetical protein [Actinoplanes solisilvae]